MKKNLFYLLTGLILGFALPVTAQTTLFSDVDYAAYYADSLNYLTSAGIIHGYGDGTFQPTSSLSRQEAVTIIKRYDDFARDRTPLTINNVSFSSTSTPGTNAGEINYNVVINFRSSKPAKIIVSGGSRQVSDNAFTEEHSAQLTLTMPKDTLPRTFHFSIKTIDKLDHEAVETRDYTFSAES